MRNIEIDSESGFCFGVVTAIRKAEEALEKSESLYCLGDIVHNAAEVERLSRKGLRSITHADLERLHDVKVLLRAHGEPPSTYATARRNNIEIIDATCPVVLQLQRRIKEAASMPGCSEGASAGERPLILIYGKPGHAEVNGLVGQTDGAAIVVRDLADLDSIDLSRPIRLYSQTTKSISGFREIVAEIERRKKDCGGDFEWFDTICRQVANRMDHIREFARAHDVVIFVSGAKSSNGKVLFNECLKVNPSSYQVSGPEEIDPAWIADAGTVGICGATSTPGWLMEDVAAALEKM
ncbi:MAG: 4-hydroxy-3-methylbut-2-enyl diphosphate reductase [Muribaculaceae bacterium]|nr:4-hydroxy-3-methylbut-2-enyl diphosphate reductase [Muribaculaceae bacterium]MDE5923943.1 4-hydroxy-3-methylbut-2-enyl diphosphate reductase [Muribaculaceae bacterium]